MDTCLHWAKEWHRNVSIYDDPLSRSALRSFAQKQRRNQRSLCAQKPLMVFVPRSEMSSVSSPSRPTCVEGLVPPIRGWDKKTDSISDYSCLRKSYLVFCPKRNWISKRQNWRKTFKLKLAAKRGRKLIKQNKYFLFAPWPTIVVSVKAYT